jgi:DMSO/TMAO reductase YedYZ molybdopterin-dependent catalytic subunit
MAINAETKEFFGTGGGTYTYVNGKYTEKIEFFSRDSSRVGAVLSFDGMVNGKVWTHKGLNSRGEPLHEEWTREQ